MRWGVPSNWKEGSRSTQIWVTEPSMIAFGLVLSSAMRWVYTFLTIPRSAVHRGAKCPGYSGRETRTDMISVDLLHLLVIFLVKKNLLPVFSRCICIFSLHSPELMGQLVPSALGPSAHSQLTPSLVALRVSASTDSNGLLLHGRMASSGTSAACPGALWRSSQIRLDQPQIFAMMFLYLCCFQVPYSLFLPQSLSITSSSKQHFSLADKESSNHS